MYVLGNPFSKDAHSHVIVLLVVSKKVENFGSNLALLR